MHSALLLLLFAFAIFVACASRHIRLTNNVLLVSSREWHRRQHLCGNEGMRVHNELCKQKERPRVRRDVLVSCCINGCTYAEIAGRCKKQWWE
ncbi:hypothetical protein L596_010540 [Steinernema carpocapsae]|uniref:Insulin-like domain-containing protein n=1 Tax=Steinernema carpocapsae TaxID=34508 RepID=A0A4U5PIL3_STECR|nr:hypothetical protein L596_010540 [Steinernema carpocapsae]